MDKLPEGWYISKLSDVVEINSGIALPSLFNNSYKNEGSIPFYKVAQMNNDEMIMCDSEIYFSEELSRKHKIKVFPKGSILIPKRGGAILTNKKRILTQNASYDSNIMGLKSNESILSYLFLYKFLLSIDLGKFVDTSSIPQINNKHIDLIQIPVPPLLEQTRIVNKLDALLGRIEKSIVLLEENIQYTQAFKKSIIENTFIKLLNHSKTFKIKEIAEIKGGKRLPKGETVLDEKTDYPYIRVTDFNDNGTIDISNLKYLKKEVQEQIRRYIITSKDLYISIAGTIGKTGIIPKELDYANLTENAARLVFKPNQKINNRFIYYFTLSNNFKEQVGLATKTVAQPKLALTRLAEVEIPIPSIEIQDKEVKEFDLISSKINEILKHQQSKLTYLKALKASILDKAFKGEL